MTEDQFRQLALKLREAVEGAHMGHPDFRVGGKIFASLLPDKGLGMVKLIPEQQRMFIENEPDSYRPASGSWGLKGATNVILEKAEADSVRMALEMAWRNTAPRKLLDQ